MTRRWRALASASVLVAALVLSPAQQATAAPAPAAPTAAPAAVTPDGDLDPAMLAALRRDLSLTAEQVHARRAVEAAAPALERQLSKALGAAFAGAWLNADGGRLVVGVTSARAAAQVRAAGAEAKVVSRSIGRLDATKAALDAKAARAGRAVHAWYVDVATNSVVVAAAQGTAATAFAAAGGVPAGDVRVVVQAETPRTLYDIRGGDQYVINGNTLCSIGFAVAGGFVTAGHCGGVNSPTLGYNNVSQGTFRGSSFPGNDYAWVQTNGSWTSQPWVNNYSGGNVTVAGSQEAAVNSSVCRSGRTTGWRCGTIQAKNITVNYAQGAVYGLTQTNACAEGGDSGGAWVTGNQAQGVTSGGSGNCTTGGQTFFQPVNEILGAYGLSLTTTGGGSTSRIIGLNNRCIDIPNSNTADGNQLQVWDCNGTGAQAWTFAGDGSVRALGKCMDVSGGSTADGAIVQLWTCNGSAAQKWVLSGAGDLVNPQADKCVDVKDNNQAIGAKLHIWTCVGAANQKWRLG